ncbi:hypothetical protein JCM3766R1_004003 [Sporobolomyces carnicolor]
MLDHFTILTPGGLVLWSRSFTPTRPPLDALIREALIDQHATTSTSASNVSRFDSDQSTLLYSFENSLPLALVFVVSYQRILNLSYPSELLDKARRSFVKSQSSRVESLKNEMTNGTMRPAGAQGFEWAGWPESFDKLLKELEGQETMRNRRTKPRSSAAGTPLVASSNEPTPPDTPATAPLDSEPHAADSPDAQTIARNIAALKARQKAASRASRSRGTAGTGSGTDTDSNAGSESDASPAKPKRTAKTATKWADSSLSAADLAAYDYSSPASKEASSSDTTNLVSKEALGKRDAAGMYEVADYDIAADSSDDSEDDEPSASTSASSSTFSSIFARLSLSSSSSKVLTKADLAPILQQTQSHLIAKNVASPIAASLIESIGLSLEGKPLKSSSWTRGSGIRKEVKAALTESLTKVLTPKTSTDLLLEITRKRSSTSNSNRTIVTRSSAAAAAAGGGEPYTIAFVGVNGVGKSTNLSKVAFWLLQNKMRVLIAACDTFRSGAVEQLRVHVNNLGKLDRELGGQEAEKGRGKVELFEKGYGKDAANIAKDAISYAKQNAFDVVLIDSSGRMQDNEPLMRALAKLISLNQPDKVIFVGEALVGNEAVDQLTKFDRSLKDFSGAASGNGGAGERKQARGIDGMILTKFDTIDDKVGAALSMTYTTGQPIYFVGCGQTYSDLRMLRVNHIVQALLQD